MQPSTVPKTFEQGSKGSASPVESGILNYSQALALLFKRKPSWSAASSLVSGESSRRPSRLPQWPAVPQLEAEAEPVELQAGLRK